MITSRRNLIKLAGVSTLASALNFARMAEAGATGPLALPFALTTPAFIDAAALKVRDLDGMTAYYTGVLGLQVLEKDTAGAVLGAGGQPLLHLLRHAAASLESPQEAGLFHIAWLMPTRVDLGRWLVHAATIRVPVDGFADHHVSEAIYLTDPEGNGIEVYADRPRDKWEWQGDMVRMGTNELDLDAIAALADRNRDTYTIAPDALRIGHIHLRVGDVAQARGFYQTMLGFASTRGDRPDAAFLSTGGYHHHIAVNSWNSAGAAKRDPAATGLDWFSVKVKDERLFAEQTGRFTAAGIGSRAGRDYIAEDPWGTRVRLITEV